MAAHTTTLFPKSRLATNDVCAVGMQKHHVAALIEVDVTLAREKLNRLKSETNRISFTAWLVNVISTTVKEYDQVAGYLGGKRKRIVFDDVNVSLAVEKEVNGHKVPLPLVVEKAHERSIESITRQIDEARNQSSTGKDIVLRRKSGWLEQAYFLMPGFVRRFFWHYLLRHPKLAFGKMGNVAITSVGMMGNVYGWFIPISVHPVCFGISQIVKKPMVVEDKIEIREVLPMSVLLDHDVADGGDMARFLSALVEKMEKGAAL
jgi:pyruvate/2-oxoglutarate dehydrogenase complex dihydrolipoamide acyltransferase (E2) component